MATEEIRFGDNDKLAAMMTSLAEANLLVILTDQEGLYDRDPRMDGANLISVVQGVTAEIEAMVGGSASRHGTGGMSSKLEALLNNRSKKGAEVTTYQSKAVYQGPLKEKL